MGKRMGHHRINHDRDASLFSVANPSLLETRKIPPFSLGTTPLLIIWTNGYQRSQNGISKTEQKKPSLLRELNNQKAPPIVTGGAFV